MCESDKRSGEVIAARLAEQASRNAIRITLHAQQEMADAVLTDAFSMKCTIHGCPGHYERKLIVHTVKQGDEVLVFNHVPADVCDFCADTLLAPETVQRLEELLRKKAPPGKLIPLYAFA